MFRIEIGDGEKANILLELVKAIQAEAVVKTVMVLETEDEQLAAIARRLGGGEVEPAGQPAGGSAPAGEVKRRGGRPKKNQVVEKPAEEEKPAEVPFQWPPQPVEFRVVNGPLAGRFMAYWEVTEAVESGELDFGTFLDRRNGTKARVQPGKHKRPAIVEVTDSSAPVDPGNTGE